MRLKHILIQLGLSFLLDVQHMTAVLAANYSVVQDPPEVLAIVGDNVTLRCAFSLQAEQAASTKGAMSWFRGSRGEESTVVPGHRFSLAYPDSFLSSGEGRLVITNVSLEDAGSYTCQVMVWGQEEARGNGVKLHVYVELLLSQLTVEKVVYGDSLIYPKPKVATLNNKILDIWLDENLIHTSDENFSSLQLLHVNRDQVKSQPNFHIFFSLQYASARPSHPIVFLQLQTEPKSRWTLVCRTGGFYPAQVWLMWDHAGLLLPSSQQNCFNPAGSLQASSHLDLPDPYQRASYTCSVEHPSLPKPLQVQYHYVPQHQASLPPSVIEVLNLLKMGTIFGIVIGLLTTVCINYCRKGSRK